MTAAAHVSYPAEGVGMTLMDNRPRNFGTYDLLEKIYAGLEEVKRAGCKVVLLASDNPDYFMAHAYLSEIIGAYSGAKISGDPLMWRKVTHELERGPLLDLRADRGPAGPHPRRRRHGPARSADRALQGARDLPHRRAHDRGRRRAHRAREQDRGRQPMREEAIAWGARIAKAPKWSLQACKRGLYQAWDMHYEDGLRVEGYIFNSTMRPATIEIMKKIQARYDEGADSWAAYELR